MAGLAGTNRAPRAPVRERRNFDSLSEGDLVGPGEVIALNSDGQLTLSLLVAGGLENSSGELSILLNPTNPGLALAAAGLSVLVQGVLDVDGSGIFVNIGNGLENASSAIAVALATDPGLEFSTGDLRVQLDGSTLTRGAGGLSVTAPEGAWSVTAVQTGTYGASVGEYVLCDPSGAGFTVNLPAASGNAGRRIGVKNTTSSTNTITIDGNGAETIDGATTTTITTGLTGIVLVCDGSGWHIE